MSQRSLPKEIIALLHHVELNRAGWPKKAMQNLILSTLWLQDSAISLQELIEVIQGEFHGLSRHALKTHIESLCSHKKLVYLPNGKIKLADKTKKELDEQITLSEQLLKDVENRFLSLVEEHRFEFIEPEKLWLAFHDNVLLRIVHNMGARTYELISNTVLDIQPIRRIWESFLKGIPAEQQGALDQIIQEFLDPKCLPVRNYLIRLMNASFCAQALALDEETINRLVGTGTRPSFILFLDTNMIFSILDLHENPSNEAVNSLMNLLRRLTGRVNCKLYVTPITIQEANRVLDALQFLWEGIRPTMNLLEASARLGGSFFEKYRQTVRSSGTYITPNEYLRPYVQGLPMVLNQRGIAVFNEKMDQYTTRQDVIDDINEQGELEKQKRGDRPKGYEQLKHDMVLWHFVRDKRPRITGGVIDAQYWIVTIDYGFLAFDSRKRRNRDIPVCLHPATLLQLLQFWVPRSSELEDAIFSNIRLPFFLQELEPEGEKAVVEILRLLGRYENVDDLSPEVIRHLLVNESLKRRLENESDVQKRIELIKEELLKQLREKEQELRKVREQAIRSEQIVREKDATIAGLKGELDDLRKKLEEEVRAREGLEEKMRERENEQLRNQQRTRFLLKWVIVPVLVIFVGSIAISGILSNILNFTIMPTIIGISSLMLIVWLWLADRRGMRDPIIQQWPFFDRLHKLKAWVFAILGTLILGVLTNAVWDAVKKIWR